MPRLRDPLPPPRLPVNAESVAAPTLVEVAAAVILRSDGHFLLAQRPAGKVYAGYWEFPGGKAERGEPLSQTLARELHEELGIEVTRAYPWIVQRYVYPHAHVQLHFFRVVGWNAEPHPREQQRLVWAKLGEVSVAPMLPANGPVIRALALPEVQRSGIRFVVIGKKGWKVDQFLASLPPEESFQLAFSGFVSEFMKYRLLRHCEFLVYPSIYEGFGIPARTVKDKADLDAALIEMIESPAAFVLNVMVPHQEHVLPMIPSGMTVKDMIKA